MYWTLLREFHMERNSHCTLSQRDYFGGFNKKMKNIHKWTIFE